MGRSISLILASGFLVLLVVASLLPWRGWMHTVNHERLYAAPPLPLHQGVRITQTIRPRYPGLYRIDILLHNQPVDNGEIALTVKTDCDASNVLAKSVIPESILPVMSFHPFTFEPLDLPSGQELCLELSTTAVARSNNLAVGASLGDANPDGEASYVTPEPDPGTVATATKTSDAAAYRLYVPLVQRTSTTTADLDFDVGYRLYYATSPIGAMEALLTYLTAYKPGIFGSSWFYPFVGGVYLVILGLFLMLVWKSPASSDCN